MNVSIRKTVALFVALAKLHNFCIDWSDKGDLNYNANDEWNLELNGAVPLVPVFVGEDTRAMDNSVPEQLLHGGEHFDDIGKKARNNRRRRYIVLVGEGGQL